MNAQHSRYNILFCPADVILLSFSFNRTFAKQAFEYFFKHATMLLWKAKATEQLLFSHRRIAFAHQELICYSL